MNVDRVLSKAQAIAAAILASLNDNNKRLAIVKRDTCTDHHSYCSADAVESMFPGMPVIAFVKGKEVEEVQ